MVMENIFYNTIVILPFCARIKPFILIFRVYCVKYYFVMFYAAKSIGWDSVIDCFSFCNYSFECESIFVNETPLSELKTVAESKEKKKYSF